MHVLVKYLKLGKGKNQMFALELKLKQISPSDEVAPGYVAIIEFGTPQVRIVEKCRL